MLAESLPWLLNTLVGSALLLFGLWLLSVRRRDAGLVDVGWTVGVGLAGAYYALFGPGWPLRRAIVALMIGAWALRLAAYIVTDRVLPPGEDGRYRALREYWGKRADFYYFFFFVGQCTLVALFSLPFLPLVWNVQAGLSGWEIAGLAVWAVSVAGEVMADRQLARFRADAANRGKVCRVGLWNYSRHPNYFFEWLHWWAYVLMAIGVAGGWLTLVGPALMLVFLMRITGIPHTEKRARQSRGEAYREYQRTTSMFIPLPPRRRAT
ncbi:MAG: DUF1295 domain-containing protein [Kiritimatiellae bacterium]|nr:DUF1295 domain-containing protein [Kiritimatiellia bacterium]